MTGESQELATTDGGESCKPEAVRAGGAQPLHAALLEQFRHALQSEAPPRGLPEGFAESDTEVAPVPEASDLYGFYPIWSALTALVQETKLQGRSFGQLKATLEAERLSLDAERLVSEPERLAPAALEAFAEVAALRSKLSALTSRLAQQTELEKTLTDTLLDIRDRLHRSLYLEANLETTTAQHSSPKTSWWRRLLGVAGTREERPEARDAQFKGQALILERLDAQLKRLGIRSFEAQAQPFDPHRMNAVDIELTDAVPSGQVVEVYSPGYLRGEEVLRVAHVKVARHNTLE